MGGTIGQLGTLPYGLTTTNAITTQQRIVLYEMQYMIGSFATPDGADWGEANIKELDELISECN